MEASRPDRAAGSLLHALLSTKDLTGTIRVFFVSCLFIPNIVFPYPFSFLFFLDILFYIHPIPSEKEVYL